MTDDEKMLSAAWQLVELKKLPPAQQQEFKDIMRIYFKGNESGTRYIEALIQAAGI